MRSDIQSKLEQDKKNISHEIESLSSRVAECNPEAARLIFEAKNSIENMDQEAMSFMLMDDITYEEFGNNRKDYIAFDSRLLDIVDKFVRECKCGSPVQQRIKTWEDKVKSDKK